MDVLLQPCIGIGFHKAGRTLSAVAIRNQTCSAAGDGMEERVLACCKMLYPLVQLFEPTKSISEFHPFKRSPGRRPKARKLQVWKAQYLVSEGGGLDSCAGNQCRPSCKTIWRFSACLQEGFLKSLFLALLLYSKCANSCKHGCKGQSK